MRRIQWWSRLFLLAVLLAPLSAQTDPAAPVSPPEKADLRVLYVGDDPDTRPGSSERAQAFKRFLEARFRDVRIRTHATFKPDDRKWCDVAVLDWHQGGAGLGSRPRSPLGRRGDWNRPVVMIGSAGLNTAMSWEVFGGSG